MRRTRFVSVIAATAIALACGTNVGHTGRWFIPVLGLYDCQYAYSAWGPDFASRMKLSSTQSNLIVCDTPNIHLVEAMELRLLRAHLEIWVITITAVAEWTLIFSRYVHCWDTSWTSGRFQGAQARSPAWRPATRIRVPNPAKRYGTGNHVH